MNSDWHACECSCDCNDLVRMTSDGPQYAKAYIAELEMAVAVTAARGLVVSINDAKVWERRARAMCAATRYCAKCGLYPSECFDCVTFSPGETPVADGQTEAASESGLAPRSEVPPGE